MSGFKTLLDKLTFLDVAMLTTDANDNKVLAAGQEQYRLTDTDLVAVAGTAFAVPTGFTVGSAATGIALTSTTVDTDGTLADLTNDYVNVPPTATHVRVSANVVFDSNATGQRYIALEQYFSTGASWVPISGFYDIKTALSGVQTPMNFNVTLAALTPANFPRLRIAVGQTSGGNLNCTPVGATFEFLTLP